MKVTENFSLEEFACHDGTKVPAHLLDNVKVLATNLEIIRAHFNKPLTINSSYRHKEYNARIGGTPNSQHLAAKAADINVEGVTPKELYEAIEFLIDSGMVKQGGIGLYQDFVHYDIRGVKARWNYEDR